MCGVIGVRVDNATDDIVQTILNVFHQSVIRGRHACGYSYVKNGELFTVSYGIAADKLIDEHTIRSMIDTDNSITMIGHIRYSTSDLKFNQPITSDVLSIVHNGVISQEPKQKWVYPTETSNDSELVLRALENRVHPLERFYDKSMAVCSLDIHKNLEAFRNHERPLWYTVVDGGIIFTSTKDIAKRSGLKTPQQCMPFVIYKFDSQTNDLTLEKRPDYDLADLQPAGS